MKKVPFDDRMAKHLLGHAVEVFWVSLPRPLRDYTGEELIRIGIRFAVPIDQEKKRFVVRTCCGRCYRVEHEGLGPHLYSIHMFANASNDQYALGLLEKHEAMKNIAANQGFAFA